MEDIKLLLITHYHQYFKRIVLLAEFTLQIQIILYNCMLNGTFYFFQSAIRVIILENIFSSLVSSLQVFLVALVILNSFTVYCVKGP